MDYYAIKNFILVSKLRILWLLLDNLNQRISGVFGSKPSK